MSYDVLVNEAKALSQEEKLDLLAVLVGMLKLPINDEDKKSGGLVFPSINPQMEISADTMSMVIGKLPDGFDVDAVTAEMWEHLAT